MSAKTTQPPKPKNKTTAERQEPKPAVKSQPDAKARQPGFALGLLSDLIEFESVGYIPMYANVQIPKRSRKALKRLAVTLDAQEARLSDGTLVKNSVPKAVAWLIEQFSKSIST